MIAKRLNIKFVNLRYTKIDNYITFARDNEEKYVDIKMNFQKKIFNRKSINISKKFISKYRSKKNFKYSGSPFFKFSSKSFLLESFKNFLELFIQK